MRQPRSIARKPALVPAFVIAAVIGALISPGALAQYKWIGTGGTVTYSDLPPPSGIHASSMTRGGARAAIERDPPAALGAAATTYPVVLFTARDCTPCQQARAYLQQRGVPFAERTIETQADAQAFKALGFEQPSVPAVTIGRERITGFEPGQWTRLLDAAQYPARSVLPAGYKASPAQRLASGSPGVSAGSSPRDPSNDTAPGHGGSTDAAAESPGATQAASPLRTRVATPDSIRPVASTLRF